MANRKHKNWRDSINDTESLTSVSPVVLLASSTEQSTPILPVDVDVSDYNDAIPAVPDAQRLLAHRSGSCLDAI